MKKGESLRDTVQTIEAMGVDAMVVRHRAAGAPHRVAGWIDAASSTPATAATSTRPRPSSTSSRCAATADRTSTALHVAIVGDIRHSRVARSDDEGARGARREVTLVGPPTMLPESLDGWPAASSCDLDDVLPEVDVIYLLRIQHERQDAMLFPSLREYTTRLRAHRRARGAAAEATRSSCTPAR